MANVRDRAKALLQTALDIAMNDAQSNTAPITEERCGRNNRSSSSSCASRGGSSVRATEHLEDNSCGNDSSVRRRSSPYLFNVSQTSTGRNDDNAMLKEHSKLFGYFSKAGSKRKRSGSTRSTVSCSAEKIKPWNHDCVCLARRNHNQVPSLQEKMDLAVFGLGLKRLSFADNAGQQEIDAVILRHFCSCLDEDTSC